MRNAGIIRFGADHLLPPVASNDPNPLLGVTAKSKFRRGKQSIDNQHVTIGAVIDDFGLTIRADDEQRRHLALNNARREFDIDLAAIVIGADWPPGRIVA